MQQGQTFKMLRSNGRKGDNGVVLVLGGSAMYTGAPIFAANGALRSGSDIVYIMTASEAVPVIKLFHEAIVMPFCFESYVLDKVTACIVGPGLGLLAANELSLVLRILSYLDSRETVFIIDADAIHLYKQGYMNDLKTAVLTPNYREADGLVVQDGHVCVYKNSVDQIRHRGRDVLVSTPSSEKRCGGQGDILSGVLATALSINQTDQVDACVSSCELVRMATHLAFKRKGFSLITSDIFEDMPEALAGCRN